VLFLILPTGSNQLSVKSQIFMT